MQIDYTSKDVERFWSKVDKSGGENACWIWVSGRSAANYGIISLGGRKGKDHLAHRVMYEITFGEIPVGLCVLHKCDNPPCVNPDHLFLGTQLDNINDMITKKRNFVPIALRGEQHGHHKLTDKQVEEIRQQYKTDKSSRILAKIFGVSKTHILRIVNYKNRI